MPRCSGWYRKCYKIRRKFAKKMGCKCGNCMKNRENFDFRPKFFRRKIMFSSKFWARSSRARRDLGVCEEEIQKFMQKLQFWDARKWRLFGSVLGEIIEFFSFVFGSVLPAVRRREKERVCRWWVREKERNRKTTTYSYSGWLCRFSGILCIPGYAFLRRGNFGLLVFH